MRTRGRHPVLPAILAGALLLSLVTSARTPQSDAATLSQLFAELHVDPRGLSGVPLDRRISNYAFENGADTFSVAFYWDDDIRSGLLPDRFQIVSLDRTAKRWVSRSLDDTDLPRTNQTPEGVGIGSIMELRHTPHYVMLTAHSNPSAGGLLVLTRDLQPKALLYGWPLFTVANESIVYHRAQIHFAPTHWLEVYMYDPSSGVDRKIHPLKPYGEPRLAFMKSMKRAYARAGEAWCRENNHHCDPELFDSSWQGSWAVNEHGRTAAFVVQFGIGHVGRKPEGPDDSVPTEEIVVTCRNLADISHVTCAETRLKALQSSHPGLGIPDLLKVAARGAAR
jgi:hypothetical protein